MNKSKKELIEALNYLGEYPNSSLKKDDLLKKIQYIYDENIEILTKIISVKIYDLIKALLATNKNTLYVACEFEPEVDFLESVFIIKEAIYDDDGITITLNEEMKDKLTKIVNKKNERIIEKNQKIVDLFIDIVEIYGIIEDYEILNRLNKFASVKVSEVEDLVNYHLDLKRSLIICEREDEVFFTSIFVDIPQEIIEEREKINLYYKDYTIQELVENKIANLSNNAKAMELIKFLEKKGYEYAQEITMAIIINIMSKPKVEIETVLKLIDVDIEDIDEANKYLQIIMDIHNSVPHYSLYGYSPEELLNRQIQERQKEDEERKKQKIGRNEPCSCGSGKKYKNCCLNKVIRVDFRNEKYADCVEEENGRMFFALKNLLFDYANQKYNINSELQDFSDICNAEPEELKEIREKIWNDKNIINNYIKENPNELSEEFIDVLKQWNDKKINKDFVLYKYEKNYSVFMDEDSIYYVKGLKERIRDMIPTEKLPMLVKTVLLPLKNEIIYDSYFEYYSVSFGKGIKEIWDNDFKRMLKGNKVKYEL